MINKITFLSSDVPLTKSFELENGELKKISHPRIIETTSYEEEWETIEDLFKHITNHAAQGHCLLKGNTSRQLVHESRAGSTDSNAPTYIICLDFDGLKDVDSIDVALKKMGTSECDHIIQWSSSMGIVEDRGLSAHVFIPLSKAQSPQLLKQWLIGLNMSVRELRDNLGLTRTNNALRYTLDITTCQNDKLIYITPPIKGPGVTDTFIGERIQLVKQECRSFDLPTYHFHFRHS